MTDIVERLRADCAKRHGRRNDLCRDCAAADEIERLRSQLTMCAPFVTMIAEPHSSLPRGDGLDDVVWDQVHPTRGQVVAAHTLAAAMGWRTERDYS